MSDITDFCGSVLSKIDVATAVMVLIFLMGAFVLYRVQQDKNNDFNFEDMLRDEQNKPSAFRLAIFVSLAVSTWVIMYITLKTNALDTWMFLSYLAIWSGAKIAETALNAYSGKSTKGFQRQREDENFEQPDEPQKPRFSPPSIPAKHQ